MSKVRFCPHWAAQDSANPYWFEYEQEVAARLLMLSFALMPK